MVKLEKHGGISLSVFSPAMRLSSDVLPTGGEEINEAKLITSSEERLFKVPQRPPTGIGRRDLWSHR
jgi:hypothetical protein